MVTRCKQNDVIDISSQLNTVTHVPAVPVSPLQGTFGYKYYINTRPARGHLRHCLLITTISSLLLAPTLHPHLLSCQGGRICEGEVNCCVQQALHRTLNVSLMKFPRYDDKYCQYIQIDQMLISLMLNVPLRHLYLYKYQYQYPNIF